MTPSQYDCCYTAKSCNTSTNKRSKISSAHDWKTEVNINKAVNESYYDPKSANK